MRTSNNSGFCRDMNRFFRTPILAYTRQTSSISHTQAKYVDEGDVGETFNDDSYESIAHLPTFDSLKYER